MTNKLKNVSEYLNKTGLKIGLLGGGGQLGRAIIDGLFQDDSISKILSNQLIVSYGGSEKTKEILNKTSWKDKVEITTDNEYLVKNSCIVILLVRPQDAHSLDVDFAGNKVVLSLIAGISAKAISSIINYVPFVRVCLPSHDSFVKQTANAMLFTIDHPNKELLKINKTIAEEFFKAIPGIDPVAWLPSENVCHVFGVLACLSSAMVLLNATNKEMKLEEVEMFLKQHECLESIPEIEKIFKRAQKTASLIKYEPNDKYTLDEYLEHLVTKGGLTERLLNAIKEGKSIVDSLEACYDRCKTLSDANDKPLEKEFNDMLWTTTQRHQGVVSNEILN